MTVTQNTINANTTTPLSGAAGGTGVNNAAKTLTYLKNMSFTAADDTGVYTLPTGTQTLVPTGGTGATGTWGISISGTAASVTTNANLTGDVTSSGNTTSYNNNVPLNKGGMNAAITASNGGIFYSTGSAGALLSGTATALQILQSGASTTPAWSTATYPATTTAQQILYSSATNVIGGLATANSSVLITDGSGNPSLGTTLPTGVQTNITSVGTIVTGVWHGTVVGATYGGTGVNNGSSTITLGGSLTTSGAFATTLTTTGATSVTLPTSGTLATTLQAVSIGTSYTISNHLFSN